MSSPWDLIRLLEDLSKLLHWIFSHSEYFLPVFSGLVAYGVFHFLDRNVSQATKDTISGLLQAGMRWLSAKGENRAVAAAIREVFDRIYIMPFSTRDRVAAAQTESKPEEDADVGSDDGYRKQLWTWRAFGRSALITLVATYVLTYIIFRSPVIPAGALTPMSATFLSGIPVNIAADYLALFVIRGWLAENKLTVGKALFTAPLAGVLLVISFMGFRMVPFIALNLFVAPPSVAAETQAPAAASAAHAACFPFNAIAADARAHVAAPAAKAAAVAPPCEKAKVKERSDGVTYLAEWDADSLRYMLPIVISLHFPGVLAACLVHLWLPVFALCIGILASLHFVLKFIAIVENRPLQAIGFVAAPLTMLAIVLLRGLAAALSYS